MPQKILLILLFLFTFQSSFSQKDKLTKKEVFSLLAKSDSLMFKSSYKQSLSLSYKALNHAFELNDNKLISLAYNSIAGTYEEILEEDKALAYYKKAIFHTDKAGNDTLKIWFYNNIGNIYLYRKNQIDKSIEYYDKSLGYSQQIKDTGAIVLTKMNKSWALFQKKNNNQAIENLNYAEKYIEHMRYPDTETYLNLLLGIKFNYLKDNEKAGFYFNEAINLGKKNNLDAYLSDAYEQYANHLFAIGDYKNAYLNLDNHEEVKDRVFNSEKVKNTQIVALKIELDQSKKEIKKIAKENSLQTENLKKTKIIVILILVFLLLLMLILYVLYRNNIFRKKVNDYLEDKNIELKIAKEKAEEASKLKTQFISTISHELRTPLYGVVGITNMLSDEHKELADSPHLNSLKFSARYLLSLVNDLLQINKIEENKVVLENLAMNIADEIKMVSNSLSFIASRNNNKIVTQIDSKIPEYLVGDKLRLSQILMNLVSNGLKFTQDGEVRIIVNLERNEKSNCFINFVVEDTGMGIAEKDLGKIFDKFVQIDRKEDDYQGAGLGLSIVKKLITLFGSEISVESKEGQGTKFTFTIGFDSDITKVNEIINNIQVDLSTDQVYKVLVVEDNKINQMVTRKIMEKNNFKTIIVDDGYAAIEALNKESFDVVLMDINMPLINGFDTTRLIRKKGITIPIIALTAFAKDEISEEAISSGMNDVLVKPFEQANLIHCIETLVKKTS
ncbi:MAG TPA: response regulator [Flavobacterium sp.]|jgi:signal transduction histidine kinase/ActR/RegA family two-component response regulator|nr:response regulator [Flavobacterium sp.]HQX03704.1 response regulator [Flavobacterium sp.]